jgi:erythronate-4-phosphate dehydrogenase
MLIMKILADSTLPNIQALFDPSFKLTLYNNQEQVKQLITMYDILICRSTLNVTSDLLATSSIKCVATASSGTDHIDKGYLEQKGIKLLDAKGSNARAVADYVVATLADLFLNKKILGKKIGIIGIGNVGSHVLSRLHSLNFKPLCFDPPRALLDPTFSSCTFDEIHTCDILCVHADLHERPPFPSKHLLDSDFFSQLKQNLIIINAARGGIVDEDALLNAHPSITYCTDVYNHEPEINPDIITFATLCTPHIAGHSIEAKQMAVIQIAQELHQIYKKIMPSFQFIAEHSSPLLSANANWIENVLKLYNPWVETRILKASIDKKQAFLKLRAAHNTRHDFNFYDATGLDPLTNILLGN